MPLRGNLRDFSTTQLLNLIHLAKKTGSLVIEGTGHGALMSFRTGKLIYTEVSHEPSDLATVLRKVGKLTDEQVRVLKTRAATASDKEMGLLLINAGYVPQAEILAGIRHYRIETVYRLLTWAEGVFRFEATLMPGEGRILVPIDLENIIMEGSRRMREWERLNEELPNLDMALKFIDRPTANIKNMNLSVEEWRVVSFINSKNTIRAIAKANNLSDLEIRRIVYGLLQTGIVELVRPAGAPPEAPGAKPAAVAAPVNKTERVGILNKLIRKIRSI